MPAMQSITCALHASAAKQLHAPKAHHEGKEKVNRIMAITGVRMRPFESQSSFRASAVSLYVISPSVSLCVSLCLSVRRSLALRPAPTPVHRLFGLSMRYASLRLATCLSACLWLFVCVADPYCLRPLASTKLVQMRKA